MYYLSVVSRSLGGTNGDSDEEVLRSDIEKEFHFCLRELKRMELKKRLDALTKELKIAEDEQDARKIQKLLVEFQAASRQLN